MLNDNKAKVDTPKGLQFFISETTKTRIAAMLCEFRAKFNKEMIPAIMWIDSALNNGSVDSQPAVGLYDNSTVGRISVAPSAIFCCKYSGGSPDGGLTATEMDVG